LTLAVDGAVGAPRGRRRHAHPAQPPDTGFRSDTDRYASIRLIDSVDGRSGGKSASGGFIGCAAWCQPGEYGAENVWYQCTLPNFQTRSP
jgi:hypothetical protein